MISGLENILIEHVLVHGESSESDSLCISSSLSSGLSDLESHDGGVVNLAGVLQVVVRQPRPRIELQELAAITI